MCDCLAVYKIKRNLSRRSTVQFKNFNSFKLATECEQGGRRLRISPLSLRSKAGVFNTHNIREAIEETLETNYNEVTSEQEKRTNSQVL